MCWINTISIPLVLKNPLKVYKTGTSTILGDFISLYQNTMYHKYMTMPTVKINPELVRCTPTVILDELWQYDLFHISEGYHSYLTEEMAECRKDNNEIGIFEIPAGATIYVDFRHREVVSTDIKYLGLL